MLIKLLLLSSLLGFHDKDSVLKDIETSLKAGSARELVKYCNETFELKINGESASYSRNQAEMVLRKFFQRNPVRGFSYIHRGSSNEGLKYSIGKYSYDSGSYRVVMFLKESDSGYQIYRLNFSKE